MKGTGAMLMVLATTALAAGALMAAAVIGKPVPNTVEPAPTAAFAPVVEDLTDANRAATLVAYFEPAPTATSSGGSGIVTEVFLEPGETVADGVPVFASDGVPVIAYESAIPFFRTLSTGARGEDVTQLQEFLADALDREVAVDGRFGPATATLVKAWQASVKAPATGVFDPTHLLRIDGEFAVATVDVAVGQSAPTLGAVILRGHPVLGDVAVTPGAEAGSYVFVSSGSRIGLTTDGETWRTSGAADDAEMIALARAAAGGSPSPEVQGASAPPTEVRIDGRLAFAEPVPTLVLPASALTGDTDGACAWIGSGAEFTGVPVRVSGTSASGAVTVDAPELAGEQVLLDAARHVGDRTCR